LNLPRLLYYSLYEWYGRRKRILAKKIVYTNGGVGTKTQKEVVARELNK
jgi:hypothetical protein